MARLDNDALKIANETLKEGFSSQAYIVKCLAEERIREAKAKSDSSDIDSFGERFAEYMAAKDSKKPEALANCVNVGIATFSELLAITSGEEHEIVADACLKIGNMP